MFPSCYILFGTAGPICGETNNRWYMYLVCCLFLVYHSQVSHLVLFHAFVVVTAISTGFFSFVCRWERPKQLNDHARVLGGFSFFLADVLRRLVSLERENIFLFFFFSSWAPFLSSPAHTCKHRRRGHCAYFRFLCGLRSNGRAEIHRLVVAFVPVRHAFLFWKNYSLKKK